MRTAVLYGLPSGKGKGYVEGLQVLCSCKVSINSALPEQTFQLVAEFADLPQGPTFVARSRFTTRHGKKQKQVVIVAENSDYRRAEN